MYLNCADTHFPSSIAHYLSTHIFEIAHFGHNANISFVTDADAQWQADVPGIVSGTTQNHVDENPPEEKVMRKY